MSPLDRVMERLYQRTGHRPNPNSSGCNCRCPAHNDGELALSVKQAPDGRVTLRCDAGCTTEAVLRVLGMKPADLAPPPEASTNPKPSATPPNSKDSRATNANGNANRWPTLEAAQRAYESKFGPVSASWRYHDGAGAEVAARLSWSNRPDGNDSSYFQRLGDGWASGLPNRGRVLYRLHELQPAQQIIVVGSEQSADAAASLGLAATTSILGSPAHGYTDWTPLAGKDVAIIPDHDEDGWKYAETVAAKLVRLNPPATVRIVDLSQDWPELPAGGDIHTWCEHHDAADPTALRERIEKLVAQTTVWKPPSQGSTVAPYKPFPVGLLPEPLRGYVTAAAKANNCDPSYVALPLLAVSAAAIGNSRCLRLGRHWKVPAILWCVPIGESGSGKSPAMRPMKRLAGFLEAILHKANEQATARYLADRQQYRQWKKTDQSTPSPQEPVEPVLQRFCVDDITVEAAAEKLADNPRGLLLQRMELSGWLGSFDRYAGKSGGDAAAWLTMYDGDWLCVDRKTGERRTIRVPRASMSLSGTIQPGVLRTALGTEHWQNGLAPRMLLVWPPRQEKVWRDADVQEQIEQQVQDFLQRLFELQMDADRDGNLQPALVHLNDDAKSLWKSFYDAHNRELVELTGELASAWSKLEETAARLALILHLIRWAHGEPVDQTVVDRESLDSAIRLVDWFKGETERVYALLRGTEELAQQQELAIWIAHKGGSVTAAELQRAHRKYKRSADLAEAALNGLVKAGYGKWLPPASTPRGGRPARRFELVPQWQSTKPV